MPCQNLNGLNSWPSLAESLWQSHTPTECLPRYLLRVQHTRAGPGSTAEDAGTQEAQWSLTTQAPRLAIPDSRVSRTTERCRATDLNLTQISTYYVFIREERLLIKWFRYSHGIVNGLMV